MLFLNGDRVKDCCDFEFGEHTFDVFFLFGVIGGTEVILEFLDRVLIVLVRSFEEQGGIAGGEEAFLQLLLFLISTLVE